MHLPKVLFYSCFSFDVHNNPPRQVLFWIKHEKTEAQEDSPHRAKKLKRGSDIHSLTMSLVFLSLLLSCLPTSKWSSVIYPSSEFFLRTSIFQILQWVQSWKRHSPQSLKKLTTNRPMCRMLSAYWVGFCLEGQAGEDLHKIEGHILQVCIEACHSPISSSRY